MITKVRSLGLGLFPAEKDISAEEKPGALDSQRDGRNGLLDAGPNWSSRRPQALEFFDAESKPGCDRSGGPPFAEPEYKPTTFKRSARTSYGLELFEAAIRETAKLREQQWAAQTVSESESQARPRTSSYGSDSIEHETKYGSESIEHEIKCRPNNFTAQKPSHGPRERMESRPTFEKAIPVVVESFWEEDFPDELCVKTGERFFQDEDRIKLVQKSERFLSVQQRSIRAQYFLIVIPKRIMTEMPEPPNAFGTSPAVQHFHIRALMVQMSNPSSVDAAVDWLMGDEEFGPRCTVGLKCELGDGRELKLIQLSVHRRCVLVRLMDPGDAEPDAGAVFFSPRLANLLATHEVIKTGTDTHDDAAAIYWATGMVVNSCQNVAEAYVIRQRPLPMLSIFRCSAAALLSLREFSVSPDVMCFGVWDCES